MFDLSEIKNIKLQVKEQVMGALHGELNKPIKFDIIPAYRDILETDHKFITITGGRACGKSENVSMYLLEKSDDPIFKGALFIYLKNFKSSMEIGPYGRLKRLITEGGYEDKFEIQKTFIRNKKNDVKFVFLGHREHFSTTWLSQEMHNTKLKDLDNVAYLVLDEAQTVRHDTIKTIVPSVRGTKLFPKSRIISTLNPVLEKDPIVAYTENEEDSISKHFTIFDLPEKYRSEDQYKLAKSQVAREENTHEWYGTPNPNVRGVPFNNTEVRKLNNKKPIGNVYAFLDPSFKGVDYTALSIGWKEKENTNNKLFVYGQCFDRAWNDCISDVIKLIKQFNVKYFYYEDNVIGSTPQEVYYALGVLSKPQTSKGSKIDRIYKYSFLAENIVLLEQNNKTYINQIKTYEASKSLGGKQDFDDAPDSLASLCKEMGF